MALAVLALCAGLWGGLIRLGIMAPTHLSASGQGHGTLMALGFLGTLVSLERAVALRSTWSFLAPLTAGLGALMTLIKVAGDVAPALLTLGGLALLAAHISLQHRQTSTHNLIMSLGAAAWVAAGLSLLIGVDPGGVAVLLAGFLALTIVGERYELSRIAQQSSNTTRPLAGAIAIFCCGLGASFLSARLGMRIAGVGMLAQGLWLARYDIARRTVRMHGITRYIASALLTGYLWLVIGGVLWTVAAAIYPGPAYDASLHAVFLGFAMSMVFAHAPVIMPALLGVPLPYRPIAYAPLVLLHLSLTLRIVGGDLLGQVDLWQWGGAGNAVAILLFLALTAHAATRAQLRSSRRPKDSIIGARPLGPLVQPPSGRPS